MTSIFLAANNASTTLAGSITNTALSANLSAGTGVEFPSPSTNQYFVGTFVDAATGLLNEIVYVTAVSSDTVTMVRAQEGTTALAWQAGDFFSNFMTAGQLEALTQPLQLQQQVGNYAADTGTANALVVTLSTVPNNLAGLVGVPIRVLRSAANTGAATIAVNGLAATAIRYPGGAALTGGEMPANGIAILMYDGTYFELQNSLSVIVPTEFIRQSSGSGNFTVPAGVFSLYIEGVGAGAGGSGSNGSTISGGAGGAGGGFKGTMSVTPGQIIAWVVGAGSAGVSSGNQASTAGNTTFGSWAGDGGVGGGGSGGTAGGVGGAASGAPFLILGGDGGDGGSNITTTSGAIGGASMYGGGGRQGTTTGGAGRAPGSGGGGCYGSSVDSGGNGADGSLYIRYI